MSSVFRDDMEEFPPLISNSSSSGAKSGQSTAGKVGEANNNSPKSSTGNEFPSKSASEKGVSENPNLDSRQPRLGMSYVGCLSNNTHSNSSTKLSYDEAKMIDGESTAIFTSGELKNHISLCESYVVGYFVGKKLPFHLVKEGLNSHWQLKGEFSMTIHGEKTFLFKFSQVEDREKVLELGSVFMGKSLFVIRPWSISLEKNIDDISTVPIWMILRQVPLHLWNQLGLSRIASIVGVPIMADTPTTLKTRMSYARVLVEVAGDCSFPTELPIQIDGVKSVVKAEYPWKPNSCSHCKSFGHSSANCSLHPAPKVVTKWVPKINSVAENLAKEGVSTMITSREDRVGGAREEVIADANGAQLQLSEKMAESSSQSTAILVQSELVSRVEITEVPTMEIAVNKPTDGEWTVYSSRKNKKKQNKVSDVPSSHSVSEVAIFHGLHGSSEVNPRDGDNLEGQDTQVIGASSTIDAGSVGSPKSDNLGLRIVEIEESCNGKEGVHINPLPVIIGKPIQENVVEGTFDDCDEEDSNEESEYETDMDEATPSKLKNLQDIRRRHLSDGQKVEKLMNANARLGVLTEGKDDTMGNIFNSLVVRSKTNPEKELGTLFWPGVSDNKNLGRGQRKSARKIRE